MSTRVKICGLTRAEDARVAIEAGADALGFVFWPRSPRAVSIEQAARIVRDVPMTVTTVGVFVDQPLEFIARTVAAVGLRAVQLHGDEPMEQWTAVPCPCIKSVPVSEGLALDRFAGWPAGVLPLLDVHDPERRGGTGATVDWAIAGQLARMRPVMLAGGLRPENVEDAIGRVAPYAVDVSSGVEDEPGLKSPTRIRQFMDAVARADARKGR